MLVFQDRGNRPRKRGSRMEKDNPSNAGSIPGLVECQCERQTEFKQTAIFLRHIEFDVVKGIRQQNVATQFDANSAANWKAVVWDDLNVLTLAVTSYTSR